MTLEKIINLLKVQESVKDDNCLRRQVYAVIETIDKQYIWGKNAIRNNPGICPRVSKENYIKCKSVCNQEYHAEVAAIEKAKELNINIEGSKIYLLGHYRCCSSCVQSMDIAGIKEVEFLK